MRPSVVAPPPRLLSPLDHAPSASIVVPILDEIDQVAELIGELQAQDYPQLLEIVFVDGGSTDGTLREIEQVARLDERIRLVHNLERGTAAGLNAGFAAARGEVLARLDGHGRYRPDTLATTIAALCRTGAAAAGPVTRTAAAARGHLESIVALVNASPLSRGVSRGGALGTDDTPSGWVDSVWNACYWRAVLDEVGPFRQDLPRAEDNDYHARIRARGYGIYRCAEIAATYLPRRSLRRLVGQFAGNGRGVPAALVANRAAVSPGHVAPAVLLVVLAGLAGGTLVGRPLAAVAFGTTVAAYGSAVGWAVHRAWRHAPHADALALAAVLPLLHIAHGVGALSGLADACRLVRSGWQVAR